MLNLMIDTGTILAGPDATSINTQIPKEYFSPSFCPSWCFFLVWGIWHWFPKYGLASSLVKGIEVVLASGEVRRVTDEDKDEESLAILDLVRGSHHHFLAVITQYELRACKAPKCVLPQSFLFHLNDRQLPIKYGRDIMHRGDHDDSDNNNNDTSFIETTVVFCHRSPELEQTTGINKICMLSLMAWSDYDEETTRALMDKYTKRSTGTVVPSKAEKPLDPHTVADACFGPLYPKARYLSNGYFGDESTLTMDDDAIFDMIQPLANSWMSNDNALPGPFCHSLVVVVNKNMKQVNSCDMATGSRT